jgi:glycoside/pentoside/hexuronide:cation symporter, GPH family
MAPSLRSRSVAAYAGAVGPMAILGLPFSVYLPPFLAENGELPVTTIGLLFAIGAAWDGIVDPIIGSLIDKKRLGHAPHRLWMLLGALPLVIMLGLLTGYGSQLSAYTLLPLLLLFYSATSLLDIAHLSWGAALSSNKQQSARLFGAREFGGKIAVVIAFGAPALLQVIHPNVSLASRIVAYAVIACVALLVMVLTVLRLPPRPVVPRPGVGWRTEVAATLRSRPLMLLAGVQLSTAFGFGSLTALIVFFVENALQLSELSSIILFLTFVGGTISAPIWTAIGRRVAKPKILMAMPMWLIAILLLGWFIPVGQANYAMLFALALGCGFLGLIFIYGMVADLAPVDAEVVGRDRTAFLFAIINVIQKIGISLGIALSYGLLGLGGFDTQTKSDSGELIRSLFVILPATAWTIMLCFTYFLQRDPQFHQASAQGNQRSQARIFGTR